MIEYIQKLIPLISIVIVVIIICVCIMVSFHRLRSDIGTHVGHRSTTHPSSLIIKIKDIYKKIIASITSAKYSLTARYEKCMKAGKRFFKNRKGRIFFFLFYIPYISFFVFLVILRRMQEADIAFKYLIFPLYFAIPILFKSTFEKLEELTDKLEEQAGIKEKKRKGGNFATDNEIKSVMKRINLSDKKYSYVGIPVIYDGGNNAFVEDSESHSLIIGSTGSGKTRRLVLPLINIIARSSESFIATDPKGELYSSTHEALENNGYNILVLNFRNPLHGNSWNPLHLPYKYYCDGNIDKAVELLNDLGLSIFTSQQSSSDAFWDNSSVDYFIGLALALFEDANSEEEVNFNSIYNMSRIGEQPIGTSRYIVYYFNLHDENSLASISASGTIHAPNDTRGGILSTFHQKIRLFISNHQLSQMLANSDFDFSDIANEKTGVFLIIQDEKSTYHPLASAFLKQSYEELVHLANTNTHKKLSRRVNYILDEFANLPPITDMENIITASRSRMIRMYLIIQGIRQLNRMYGDNVAEIIKGNCDYWYYMMSKELPLLKEISELCGTKQDDNETVLSSNSPLVSITDLQLLKMGEVLVLQKRLSPYLANMEDINKYIHFSINENSSEPEISPKSPPKVFSISSYVLLHLHDKIDQDIEKERKFKKSSESDLLTQLLEIKELLKNHIESSPQPSEEQSKHPE